MTKAVVGADLNDPLTWCEYVPPPSDVRIKSFQKKLDRIAGVSSAGLSVLKLVWGWESQEWKAGSWRLRYVFHTVALPSGDVVDLAAPRWFLEELVEPIQYREEWERNRYTVDEDSVEIVDILGPPPPSGWYVPATLIAEHDETRQCCDMLWESRRRCWGRYRAPSDDTLEMVAEAVRLREQAKMFNRPDEPLSRESFEDCWKQHFRQKDEWHARRRGKVDAIVGDFIHVFGENFSSIDPARHFHGKYKFTRGHRPSGLTADELNFTKAGRRRIG